MENSIKGIYKKSIFRSQAGYVVGLFRVKEADEELAEYINHTITFTGYFHELNEEDTYILHGRMVEHEKYGNQFQVESYERVLPEEKDAIVEFLSSGLFKGIGEKKAEKIVEYLGKDALTIILENPNNLLLIPTITKKQISTLHDTLVNYEASYKTVLKLGEIGFTTKDSLLIYNFYKEKTLPKLEENPYLFMEDIEEITFKKVDTIFLKQDIKRDDKRRIMAAIIYVLEEVGNTYGNTYLEKDELYNYTIRALANDIGNNDFEETLDTLITDIKVIKENNHYYLKIMYEAEKIIVDRIGYLSRKTDQTIKKLDSIYKDVETVSLCEYNIDQEQAIKNSFIKNFLIITGGPGTGKTTIIKAICELYQRLYKLSHKDLCEEIALLAPTGRASKRISESTNLPATTIHRFLKWNKEGNYFAVNEYHKSNVKMVIIDEFSMVDTLLFYHLLNGLYFDTKIILVGDYHQLPSVGPGQLLKDMIESNSLNVIRLKQLYRQKNNSNIITLAYQIQEDDITSTLFNKEEDLSFISIPPTSLKDKVVEIASNYSNDIQSFQVLAPMYKGINGIDILNESLQKILNPAKKNKKEIIINGILYRENDKVIQLTNMPEDNVFNGDIGYIEKINSESSKKEIIINFDGNIVTYTSSNFNKFKHAYAISIHKSQGSEFDTVIIPVVKSYGKMLYRKLIYTGITRAKKKLYLIGDYDAFLFSVHNNNTDIRKTSLKEKIEANIGITNK